MMQHRKLQLFMRTYNSLRPFGLESFLKTTIPINSRCKITTFQQKRAWLSSVSKTESSKTILGTKKTPLPLVQYPKKADTEIDSLPSEKAKAKFLELIRHIQLTEDIQALTYLYWQNKDELRTSHYLQIIEKFAELQQGKLSDPDLLKNKEFQSISYYIWKNCSTFEATEILQLYKNFLGIGVPSHFLLMQSLLQMMRHQINLFDAKDLLFMKRLLVKTSSCKLKNALEKAIPRVLENHIKSYVSPKLQIHELLQMLDMCIKENVEGAEKIIFLIYHKKLQDLFHPQTPYYYNNLLSLIWNIMDIYLLENKHKIIKPSKDIEIVINVLLNNTLEKLIKDDGLKSLKVVQILALTKKLQTLHSKGHSVAMSVEFLNSVSDIVKQWDIGLMSSIISYQVTMNYVNEDLLKSATDKLLESSSPVDFSNVKIIPLLSAIAATETTKQRYSPNIILNLLDEPHNPQPQTSIDVPWIKIALSLLSMNCLPEKFLQIILEEQYLERYLKFRSYAKTEYLDLLRLHRVLNIIWPHSSIKVPSSVLQTAVEIQRNDIPTPFLTQTLKFIVGENCIVSNIITPNLSLIDHLIFLDENGDPIPLSLPEGYHNFPLELKSIVVSDQVVPKYRLALMEIPESWTCLPDLALRGHFKVELDIIQKELNEYFSGDTIILQILEQDLNDMDTNKLPILLKERISESIL